MEGDDELDRDLLLDVVRRAPMILALREEPMDRRELEQRLGISKSTSHRNTNLLTERGMLRKSNGEHALTEFGRAVAGVVEEFEERMETTVRLAPVFDAVSGVDPACPIEAFADATVTSTDQGDPFAPLARFVALVRDTESLRMFDSYSIAPTYIDEIHGRVLDGMETDVVERPEIAEDIMEHYPRKCVQLCASEFLTLKVHAALPFGLAILDDRIGVGVRDADTGMPRAFVDTDASAARTWAEDVFDSYWREATLVERFNPAALEDALEATPE